MAKITTLIELEEIKASTLNKMCQSNEIKVVVGMGTCGISAGAGETLLAIQDEIQKRKLTNVVVSPTGCIGLCVQEPLVEVHMPGKEKVVFRLIDADKGRRIIEQYVVNGIVNQDWVVN